MAVKPKGLLIDITRCIGCGACSDACKKANDLPEEVDPVLNQDTWTVVEERKKDVFVRDLCRHCLDPACVSVCPVGALEKTPAGPVIYDKSICLGCRYCMLGCQFKIPRFEWFSPTPRIRKCILCEPRVREGKPTACAEACPTEATVFGDRDTLVKMAEARIAANPEKYDPHIYGMEEVGGTSVIFISPVPFEDIGFDRSIDKFPLPELTFRILQHVPTIVVAGAALLGGSYFLFKRKAKVAEAAAKEESAKGAGEAAKGKEEADE